jgi:hypothetical protein
MLLLGLLMVAGAVGALVGGAVNVLPDLTIRANPMVVTASTVDGTCETKRFVFTSCSAVLTYDVGGTSHEVQRDYLWVGTAQDYAVDVVVAADQPELATVSVALDRIWNRIFSVLALFALLLGLGVAALRQWRVARAARRRYHSGTAQQLFPVGVQLLDVRDVRLRGRTYKFSAASDGKRPKREQLLTKTEGEPFRLGPNRALAVHAEGGEAHPVLLDAGLTRLDLSDEERAALLASVSAPTPTT